MDVYNTGVEKVIWVNTDEGRVGVQIVRKKMKSMILRLNSSGEAVLSAGYMYNEADIRSFIEKKAMWLGKHVAHVQERQVMDAVGTDVMYWFGRAMPICCVKSAREYCAVEGERIVFYLKVPDQKTIERLWHKLAVEMILKEVERLRVPWDVQIADAYGKKRPMITVRRMRSRWGSCTPAKSSIRLSTRLVHYPPDCLEYVLLHEYVHLLVMDHSRRFYQYVEHFMPFWKTSAQKLR